ncbi:MAG: GDP-mannose 4,6-dehydratase [Planctomycetota bacterium]|nr:GDP-mannose 4,6-dehydratase [Planctomycetota bacterium]
MNSTDQHRTTLVTGGAGFIGSHLVERLLKRGDHVEVVDNLSTGSLANLSGLDDTRLTFREGSVSEILPTLDPQSYQEIYHLAAAVGVRLVIERPIHTIETNVHETSVVLEFASQHSTPMLLASTSEVYGKSTKTPFMEDDDVVYGPTIFNRWSYAMSKAIDEHLALAYYAEHDLPVVVVRFFNTVGPRQVGEYGMVLPRFVSAALKNETKPVYGDGRQTRCFCDVRDVVKTLPDMPSNVQCHGRVFNLGRDSSISILELATLVRDTLHSESAIELISYEKAFGEGFDDLRDRRPDLTRIQEATGFDPRIELVQTIRDLAEHLKAHAATLETSG